MDAIQSGSIQNSSGLLLTECEQRDAIKENTHFCSGVFSKANNVFVCSETAFFFPTVRGRRNSSKLFRFEPGSAFHPTPLMFDRIDAKIMLITETFLIEQQLMLVFDFVDLLTSRLSNLFLHVKLILATLRKGPFTAIMSEA